MKNNPLKRIKKLERHTFLDTKITDSDRYDFQKKVFTLFDEYQLYYYR